jgi:hypothetical protein
MAKKRQTKQSRSGKRQSQTQAERRGKKKPPSGGWTTVEAEFRRQWESSPDRDQMTWAQAAAGFRYGWEAAGNPMTARGRPMDEIEFDQLRRLVQHGWDRRQASATKAKTSARKLGQMSTPDIC